MAWAAGTSLPAVRPITRSYAMMKWMQGKRLDMKTSIFLVILAIIFWGVFTYANLLEFVPSELTEPRQPTN